MVMALLAYSNKFIKMITQKYQIWFISNSFNNIVTVFFKYLNLVYSINFSLVKEAAKDFFMIPKTLK